MQLKKATNTLRTEILPGILNSYSIIFFLDNKILAGIIMLVSFFNFWAGLSGLMAVIITLLIGHTMHLDKPTLRSGVYSFNALLAGIGMGTFFDPGVVYFSLLALSALFTLLLSVTMGGQLFKLKLPFLSIPFVVAFWFVVLPASNFENLGLTHRNIFWINEMYSVGGNSLLQLFQTIDNLQINKLVDIYLRSISSIFFQNNLIAGILITIALLYSSRIMFSLSVVGFLTAYIFAQFTGSETAIINYYNIGANYMMVAFAVGGYFLIPSRQSFLWTVFLIPLTSLVLLFFYKLFGYIQLPVFSLPFAFTVIIFIYFLQLRTKSNGLILTPLQHNSPEINLYTYRNNKERLAGWYYFPLHLPLMGEWTVTQGHNGEFTHKGEWGSAFDFMITDNQSKTYRKNGLICEDYYCYNKPVFAPADGYVETIINNIDDNEPGKVNTVNNWGNSIVIRHTTGLYTQISHLRKDTFKVKTGDHVKQGDLLAHCGNSGRSPEPHVHFQVQAFPEVGSKTLNYPISYYYKRNGNSEHLMQFQKPEKADIVSGVSKNELLFNAFNILPDNSISMQYTDEKGAEKTENWNTYTNAYNQKYIYCSQTNTAAYYVNDGIMFYFIAFYGNKKSLLYYFYLSAYKIFLGNNDFIETEDTMPLYQWNKAKYASWFHDFIAPFYQFIQINFNSKITASDNVLGSGFVHLDSSVEVKRFQKKNITSQSTITITGDGITAFTYQSGNKKIQAKCIKH
ncbi:MAG: peptidoglycan DD-metalloendopeptidase family protein [Bacteroidetes bacterium]|nr:peptidoglycan DD-metalloendopeptidase family protein [Bacteroidota bacterium]